MVDWLRWSGQRAEERRSESKRTVTVELSVVKIFLLWSLPWLWEGLLYTAGKILALALMGCILINFICFPRSFPSRDAEHFWNESRLRRILLDS